MAKYTEITSDKIIDYENDPLIGQTFGELTVVKRIPAELRRGRLNSCYIVKCSCGARFKVTGHALRSGQRTQCAYCSGEWERPAGY